MKLVYTRDSGECNKGDDVHVGDIVEASDGAALEVTFFREPHKPSSQGHVSVMHVGSTFAPEYYVGVIGAEWIGREDR